MTRIVVGVTGASGSIYARRLLQLLDSVEHVEVSWVASSAAELVWQQELGEPMPSEYCGLQRYGESDYGAPFASGSNAPDAVMIAPCSMSTLARVANGGGSNLIARACEVALKERRKLILVVRETPLSLVHLRNMVAATEAGAVVMPASPSFYGGAQTLPDLVDTVVARALDHAGIPMPLTKRWGDSDE